MPIARSRVSLRGRWVDPKLWYYGRLPFSLDATRHLASAFAGAYRALKKGTAKVLALDLDNTLWGGIYGEDGVAKLLCDDEFPGNAFKAFQRECLRLKSQGFLLALLSKNNPDAISAFSTHNGHAAEGGRFRRNPHQLGAEARSTSAASPRSSISASTVSCSSTTARMSGRPCAACAPSRSVPELPDDPAAQAAMAAGRLPRHGRRG